MNLLANENVPRSTVDSLRAASHDLVWARTDMAGSSAEDVLARAQAETRILLTQDKDFGDLAFHAGLPATCRIILIRLSKLDPNAVATRTTQVLGSRTDWSGHLSVIDERRVRMRRLPAIGSP